MEKHSLPTKHLINVNASLLGIEFCWATIIPNTSAIFTFLGAGPSLLAILWLVPPLVGLLLQPLIGHLSDISTSRWGRRRPFIILGLSLSFILCALLPFQGSLSTGAIFLWLLIAVLNIAHQPMRTLVADIIPSHQVTKAFAMQTVLVGIGASLGSAMPWLLSMHLSSDTISPMHQPLFLSIAIFLGGAVALSAGFWTCVTIKESKDHLEDALKSSFHLREIFSHLVKCPKILKQICFSQFFMWIAFFVLYAYMNLSIAQTLFGLPPGVDISSQAEYKPLMEKATAFNSLFFLLFQASSFCIALLLPFLTQFVSRKTILSTALFLGGAGMFAIVFNPSSWMYLLASILLGSAWGGSFAVHLAMVASHIPKPKMGLYMGIFNIANTSSQILAGAVLGPIVQTILHNSVTGLVSYCGLFLILAAFLNQRIEDKKS